MLPAFRSRWLFASSTVCSVLALAVAGCGGSETPTERPDPQLPAEVGEFFVTETEEVVAALEQGEAATARGEALELRQLVEEAIDAGRVPKPLRQPLRDAVERLIASIEVPVETAPPPPPPEEPATPEEPDCEELEDLQSALEEQLDSMEKDDPARQVVEEELQTVKDAVKECKKGGDGEEGGDGGDDR